MQCSRPFAVAQMRSRQSRAWSPVPAPGAGGPSTASQAASSVAALGVTVAFIPFHPPARAATATVHAAVSDVRIPSCRSPVSCEWVSQLACRTGAATSPTCLRARHHALQVSQNQEEQGAGRAPDPDVGVESNTTPDGGATPARMDEGWG